MARKRSLSPEVRLALDQFQADGWIVNFGKQLHHLTIEHQEEMIRISFTKEKERYSLNYETRSPTTNNWSIACQHVDDSIEKLLTFGYQLASLLSKLNVMLDTKWSMYFSYHTIAIKHLGAEDLEIVFEMNGMRIRYCTENEFKHNAFFVYNMGYRFLYHTIEPHVLYDIVESIDTWVHSKPNWQGPYPNSINTLMQLIAPGAAHYCDYEMRINIDIAPTHWL